MADEYSQNADLGSIFYQINSNLESMQKQLSDLSLQQQRNSTRLEIVEHFNRQTDRHRVSQAQSDAACGGFGPGAHPPSTTDKDNPLHLLADCATTSIVTPPQGAQCPPNDNEIEEHSLIQASESIKDRVKSTSLPPRLLMPTTQSIKVSDRKRAAVIRSSASYVTTSLKLLKSWGDKHVTPEDVQELFVVMFAHMRHLQQDMNECVFESHIPKATQDYLKFLNSNSEILIPREQQNFETACNWTIASQRAAEAESRPRFQRGRSRFRSYRGMNRGARTSSTRDFEDLVSSLDQNLPTQKKDG